MIKFLVLCIALILTACEQTTPHFDKLSVDGSILAFGDSLTYGTGTWDGADYPAILAEISAHEVINAGKPGELSQQGAKRLPALLDEYEPELLILIHGGNDLLRKVAQQKTRENLLSMIAAAQQRNIKIVMLGVPKPKIFLMSSAEIYQQIAEQHQIPIDLEILPKILSSPDLKSDTIHPNEQGYQLMAEAIYTLLIDAGAL